MPPNDPLGLFRIRAVKLPAWQVALIGAAAAALVITLAVVSFGIFLLVFPAILLLDAAYRWRARRRAAASARAANERIIDVEYEILPPEKERQDH